ncbi:RimK family alpha-L-glutamate ligase [Candidatus Woesearchaeota archaeon]|jgi:ribosomal protein S6--L-glutamate ligase|nr:RimK family alpha-L-glutamate ligase [Candidatus Woesearchaeota archaeon]MBT5397081.1 RimK family alpha-L-glutamate ligase [Candidatus Woesearchaeota archaeon]MBT6367373.1 RimK family alpha-L-glutamate ligase [Candidatus Woesearchaeota archaeon]MBT7762481.1 RimK family alpha-L-glutamate ligase [Candidatus Woesearchaeota archaeon]
MKAALISLGSTSSVMVADAMKKYFDQVDMIQLKEIEVGLGKDGGILYQGEPLEQYDCVYLKGSFRYAHLLRSIAAMLEGKVPFMPLTADAFTTVHNKLLTHLVLQQHTIPMPKTYISSTVEAAKELLKKVNYPIVMKFPEGTQGKGVMFADSISSASSLLDALGALNQPFIIQEYVETGGTDIRAHVVGDKVVAAMRRKSQTEEKRSNIHAGGTGESVQLNRESITIALKTAKALRADICGVDILESPLGPLVIEANISPGLQGISEVSTINIPDQIAQFLYRKTKEVVDKEKKVAAAEVLKDISLNDDSSISIGQEIISDLQFRGERILLPELITKLTGFSDRKEYTIKARKGKVEIEEFEM